MGRNERFIFAQRDIRPFFPVINETFRGDLVSNERRKGSNAHGAGTVKRSIIWILVIVLVVIAGCSAVAFEYFYFELCPIISCNPANRQFEAAFEWDKSIQSIGIISSQRGRGDPDRRWRRLVRSTVIQDLPKMMVERRITKASGKFAVHFHGYGTVLSEELSISEPDFDAFLDASLKGNADTVAAILASGMSRNVDACTRLEKVSAMSSAAVAGNSDVVRILAASKANMNAPDQHGQTPLMLASVEGHEETVKVLISLGANINARDLYGGTALAFAVRARRTPIVKHLLVSGASPNLQDDFGRSALMYAAKEGSVDIVKALLSAGADVTSKDKDGNSAQDIAARKGNLRVARLLANSAVAH